ncbi:MAG: Fe-S protein [Gammaproteobacteria bacterium]|nr:Fe-S protein [Gammaproteobacteria bacterium]
MIFSSNAQRPFHWGPFPLERLARDPAGVAAELAQPLAGRAGTGHEPPGTPFAEALSAYLTLFRQFRHGEPARARAPLPDDPEIRTRDIKGSAYFLDAGQAGICRLTEACWRGAPQPGHTHGIVILVEHPRLPEAGNPAHLWVRGTVAQTATLRAMEIAICLAAHIRQMGFSASAHDRAAGELDLDRLLVLAGLGVRNGNTLCNPFLDEGFAVAAVSTEYELEPDLPLAASARRGRTLGWWVGTGGATSGLERRRQLRRATHLSRYPMETVRRVNAPTTLVIDDEVPRVPKRASFFERALRGDLGDKAQKERPRFAYKHPLAASMTGLIRAMVPRQDGPVAAAHDPATLDAAANTRAIKSLSYFLGADLTGICEVPRYAWFSHREDGTPIEPYHRHAVVMLIDQGYETMEGASGDDFISGAQSMRAYMRGGEIAGVMAEFLRAMGHPARPQTNADSDVLHIPLLLWAGLGELSRIGELVLNPFVGPRFKSVVLTTDLPLVPDQPVDFGLQYFCSHCSKCARECPCDAISFGDKVMFNGYEMWKPDVERCTRYRLTNRRGLACGRCMKTCPLNKVVTLDSPWYVQVANWLGVNAMWLEPLLVPIATRLDDWLGHGVRVPAKKWWLDLEIVDGVCVLPPHGANARDIDPGRKIDAGRHKVAYYHADMMPAPDTVNVVVDVDRKAGLAAAEKVETPAAALARRARGEPAPLHYRPVPVGQKANR